MSQMISTKKTASMQRRKITGKTITYIVLTVLSIIWIIPLLWMILQAFAGPEGTYNSSSLIPSSFSLHWFKLLFTDEKYPYWNWFRNTFIIAAVCFLMSTFLTISMAYVMSRFRFKSRKTIQSVGLILGMFPGFMSLAAI